MVPTATSDVVATGSGPTGTYRLEAEGTTIRGYVNGTKVAEVTDSSVTSGGIGFGFYTTRRWWVGRQLPWRRSAVHALGDGMAFDPSIYEQKRRSINDQYSSQAAINALGRFNSQQRGDRNAFDFKQSYQQQTPKFTSSYAKRGLSGGGVQSGVYQNALTNYTNQYTTGLNRMYADTQNELNQFDYNTAQMEAEKSRAFADMEVDKAREIANAAQYLSQMKQQFGGG